MLRLERTELSDRDLYAILDFGTTRFGSRVGTEYFLSFDAAFERLCYDPFLGSPVDALEHDANGLTHIRHPRESGDPAALRHAERRSGTLAFARVTEVVQPKIIVC